jgi:hypothetical protein
MCTTGWKIAYSASPTGYRQAYVTRFNRLHLCYNQSFSVFETIQCRAKTQDHMVDLFETYFEHYERKESVRGYEKDQHSRQIKGQVINTRD